MRSSGTKAHPHHSMRGQQRHSYPSRMGKTEQDVTKDQPTTNGLEFFINTETAIILWSQQRELPKRLWLLSTLHRAGDQQ